MRPLAVEASVGRSLAGHLLFAVSVHARDGSPVKKLQDHNFDVVELVSPLGSSDLQIALDAWIEAGPGFYTTRSAAAAWLPAAAPLTPDVYVFGVTVTRRRSLADIVRGQTLATFESHDRTTTG